MKTTSSSSSGAWLGPMRIAMLLWAALVTAGIVLLPRAGFELEGANAWIKDWRAYLFSERVAGQRDDIAIILITEDSVADYPYRSPVDRGLQAELIRALDSAKPAIIGLDFIYDRPSYPDKDAALLAALKSTATPIVLGAIDRRLRRVDEAAFAYQDKFIADSGRQAAHLFFEGADNAIVFTDEAIRYAASTSPVAPYRKSFAEALASHDGKAAKIANRNIDWLKPPLATGEGVFLTLEVPRHKPVSGAGNGDDVLPPSWRRALAGKIVLVGGAFVDRDQHLTPLSILTRERVPGVTIHAQIVAQLRDGRTLVELPTTVLAGLVFLLAALGFFLGWHYRMFRSDVLVAIVGTLALIAAGAFAFVAAKLLVPGSLLVAWVAGISGGHFVKPLIARRF
ncbi:MAG: CHASE2 domain-containing protein [Hyphomicrobiaceae bacterium]|nr:CHASE2 domain-containing protein [Hyphomicrobiaceae bacterium]